MERWLGKIVVLAPVNTRTLTFAGFHAVNAVTVHTQRATCR
jgi:hypothetical protein